MAPERPFHAVLLFPQAVEAMGGAIGTHIRSGAFGPHVVCHRIDVTGPFFEMVFEATSSDGLPVEMEVMVPHAFIRMVLSVRGEGSFGFSQRWPEGTEGGGGDRAAPDAAGD